MASHHTELGAYAGLRSGDARLRAGMDMALASLYAQCQIVLSPSEAADESLRALGVPAEHIGRWGRGVDLRRFDPALREPGALPGELTVLYAGRLTTEKGVDLLADAFLAARAADPRLHLVLAGGGPEEEALRERLGSRATFLGWLEDEELARAYASADMFLFASRTDTFGQVVIEAQASGLPVVAVAEGGPVSLIEEGRTGRLCPAGRRGARGDGRRARALPRAAPPARRRGARSRRLAHLGARARPARRRLPARARRGGAQRRRSPPNSRLTEPVTLGPSSGGPSSAT